MGTTSAAPSGFIAWIATYGSIIGFFAQIIFYAVIAASAAWAATTFSRYVKYMTAEEAELDDASESVSVDEFVE